MTSAERELLDSLTGTFTLDELYAAIEAADLTARDDGHDIVHGKTDTRWRRRARGALQSLKRQGRAHHAGDGVWVLDGTPEAPRTAILVSLTGRFADIELRLQAAADLLADLPGPARLIPCDPPYGLGVGTGQATDTGARTYARDASKVVAGYVDVAPADYRAFTREWVTAAAGALLPGGHLAVVTGPQQAAWVQVAAEDAGLEWLNTIAVGRQFALRTLSRFAMAHWSVTIMCKGPITSKRRVFNPPPDLPKARSGRDYPLDHWEIGDVGRADAAPGAVRYANTLPLRLAARIIGAFTRQPEPDVVPDLVVDPFFGGGTFALAALQRGVRFIGGDLNTQALAFGAHRLTRHLLDTRPEPEVLRDLADAAGTSWVDLLTDA